MESRLDQLEAKVAEFAKQLQVLTNVVTSLTVPRIVDNRDLCNQDERTIRESSRIKSIPSEIAPIRNRQFSNLGKSREVGDETSSTDNGKQTHL